MQPRAIKYRYCNEKNKRGTVVDSLAQLMKKIREKFKISESKQIYVVLDSDGTEIDDEEYFRCLPKDCVVNILYDPLLWAPSDEISIEKAIQHLLEEINKKSLITEFRNTLSKTRNLKHQLLLSTIIDTLEINEMAAKNNRDEDPKWFEGLSANIKTKEAAMKESARRRVRGYLRTASEYLEKNLGEKNNILSSFAERLKKEDYYSRWFDRSQSIDQLDCLCDSNGWFLCEGAFDKSSCFSRHRINPYSNYDSRIVFSTWNLDHRIEKSREVLPCLIKALQTVPAGKILNLNYFYELLFTRKNLKLVHISCHDKSSHTSSKCNAKEFFVLKSTKH